MDNAPTLIGLFMLLVVTLKPSHMPSFGTISLNCKEI